MQKREIEDIVRAILGQVSNRMFGLEEVIRLILVAFYTGRHVLLEGNPGLGKTDLVKTLGQVLALDYGRIQFTPDLMPADITGTYAPDFEGDNAQKLVFQKGPVFTSLLLADEINRATPKTQSAMLEAMAEKQVTVLGRKYPIPLPFMVLATQNPIDHEGTFNLPEAQSDRFMFKVAMPVPERGIIYRIMNKTAGVVANPGEAPEPVQDTYGLPKDHHSSKKLYEQLKKSIELFPSNPLVENHILNMFLASNRRFRELKGLTTRQCKELEELVKDLMVYGLGPRAVTTLMLGAKAWSLMFVENAECAEAAALARVVVPTLRHRVKLKFDWQEKLYRRQSPGKQDETNRYEGDPEVMMIRVMEDFCLAAAPYENEYATIFSNEFKKAVADILATRGD